MGGRGGETNERGEETRAQAREGREKNRLDKLRPIGHLAQTQILPNPL